MLLLRWLVLCTFFFIFLHFFLVIFLRENTKMIVNKEKKNETYETHLFKKKQGQRWKAWLASTWTKVEWKKTTTYFHEDSFIAQCNVMYLGQSPFRKKKKNSNLSKEKNFTGIDHHHHHDGHKKKTHTTQCIIDTHIWCVCVCVNTIKLGGQINLMMIIIIIQSVGCICL